MEIVAFCSLAESFSSSPLCKLREKLGKKRSRNLHANAMSLLKDVAGQERRGSEFVNLSRPEELPPFFISR